MGQLEVHNTGDNKILHKLAGLRWLSVLITSTIQKMMLLSIFPVSSLSSVIESLLQLSLARINFTAYPEGPKQRTLETVTFEF